MSARDFQPLTPFIHCWCVSVWENSIICHFGSHTYLSEKLKLATLYDVMYMCSCLFRLEERKLRLCCNLNHCDDDDQDDDKNDGVANDQSFSTAYFLLSFFVLLCYSPSRLFPLIMYKLVKSTCKHTCFASKLSLLLPTIPVER